MTRKQKIVQKGGMHGTPLPSEVFGTNSGRYHPSGSSALNMSDSAWGANVPTSRGVIIADNLMGPELGATRHSGMQTGGSRRKSNNNNIIKIVNAPKKITIEQETILAAALKEIIEIKTEEILFKKLPIQKLDVLLIYMVRLAEKSL